MSKDGTQRGGLRIGSGRKRKSLEDKILEGRADDNAFAENKSDVEDILPQRSIKPPKDYLSDEQFNGGTTYAEEIYRETYEWINSHGCAGIVSAQLIENYAQTTARYIQCERLISQMGLVAAHPLTGKPTSSPLIKSSLEYLKQSNILWQMIFAAVRDNSSKGVVADTRNDLMETLLRRVK